MGRKPKAAKVAMPENLNASMEMVGPELKMQTKSGDLSSRKKVYTIRRSGRLQSIGSVARNQEIEPAAEEINLCESEQEDEPHVEENPSESMPAERNLEEKINYIVEAVEVLKAKATKRHFQTDSPSTHLKYKSLYFDAQKKIEALTNENLELSKKLDAALGKVEVYGEANRVYSELVGKFKDVILISNLAKATETAMNLSSQVIFGGFPSPGDIGEPNRAAEPNTSASKKKKRASGAKDN